MIPKRPTNLIGNISLLFEHEHAVAVRAVEALKCVMHSIHAYRDSECLPDYQQVYGQAKKVIDEIDESGWKP